MLLLDNLSQNSCMSSDESVPDEGDSDDDNDQGVKYVGR